jgi:hypothetical protein
MKINMFARFLLHISLGTWTLFASLGVWATTENTDPVVIGEKFQIESKVLAETRTYIIHTRTRRLTSRIRPRRSICCRGAAASRR